MLIEKMKRKILVPFMDRVRLTEGYIWFNRTNSIADNDDVFHIKDGQNCFTIGMLFVKDDSIVIIKADNWKTYPYEGHIDEGSEIVFDKGFADPDCNPRYISEFIDKMVLEYMHKKGDYFKSNL